MLLTGGNVNDTTCFAQVLDAVEFRRPGPGRPATRPTRVLADKGYSSRAYLRRRPSTQPSRSGPISRPTGPAAAAPEDAHPPSTRSSTSAATSSNAASTGSSSTGPSPPRYDKTALSYQAMIDLATLKMWL